MANNQVRIPFPLKGKDENWAVSGQPPLTSPNLQNVRPRDVQDKRSRGGQRPGLRKVMYWWDYLGSGSDLGLPEPSPIIGMTQVTAVRYTSKVVWDGLVFLMYQDQNHEIQLYSYDGNLYREIDLDIVSAVVWGDVSLDSYGYIYVNHSGSVRKYHSDGTLITINSTISAGSFIRPSNKNDDVTFIAKNGFVYCHPSDAFYNFSYYWLKNYSQTILEDCVQLENSDDILICFTGDWDNCVKRVSRIDGTVITDYSSMGRGAWGIAVDEDNGWLYKVGGDDADAKTKVYRCDLSDGGNITSYTIAGGDAKRVKLYGGKVYVVGDRATDNNTVWKLDAALAGIEADYDTGDRVNDIRILADGTIYVVGVNGTNEDTDTGNVNILDSDLIYSENWNIRSGEEISAIAGRY